MRILFLNQYGRADSSPTARLLEDLAGRLEREGWEVVWVADNAAYGKRKSGWRRWFSEALVHFKLLGKGLCSPQPHLVLSLTSPVCLAITASLIAKIRGARHIHWAMDLYPDLALALGEIQEGFLSRLLTSWMCKAYRSCECVVALDRDMQEVFSRKYQVSCRIIQPWPASLPESRQEGSPIRADGRVWLYSGNLGRAHEWESLLQVQKLLEQEGVAAQLVFQGDGAELPRVKQKVLELGLKGCVFRSYAPRETFLTSLLESSVLIATRRPSTCGLLWPSKLALLQDLPVPLLWIGDTESHLAAALKQRERTGVFAPGETEGIKSWFLAVSGENVRPVDWSLNTGSLRDEGLGKWIKLLKESI